MCLLCACFVVVYMSVWVCGWVGGCYVDICTHKVQKWHLLDYSFKQRFRGGWRWGLGVKVCAWLCVYVCLYVCLSKCVCVLVCLCACVFVCVCVYAFLLCVHVCMSWCVCVCV